MEGVVDVNADASTKKVGRNCVHYIVVCGC